MKKINLIGAVVIVLVGIGIFYMYKKNDKMEVMPKSDYKNTSYVIDGKSVPLINGVSEIESAPGSVSKTSTKYFGNEIKKDLNGDGKKDIAFLLTQEAGGSGTFFYIVAALNTENGYVGSQAVLLGDRIAPQTTESGSGNSIIVNYVDRKSDEPMTVLPSVGKSLRLILDPTTMQFKEVAEDIVHSVTYFKSSVYSIVVESPLPGSIVKKEFVVTGKARGSWFFEASFPIKLLDKNGAVLAIFIAEAKSDWMTENFIPFKTTIKIPESYTGPVTLMLEKDNPSGLSEYDASVSFSLEQSTTTTTSSGSEK